MIARGRVVEEDPVEVFGRVEARGLKRGAERSARCVGELVEEGLALGLAEHSGGAAERPHDGEPLYGVVDESDVRRVAPDSRGVGRLMSAREYRIAQLRYSAHTLSFVECDERQKRFSGPGGV